MSAQENPGHDKKRSPIPSRPIIPDYGIPETDEGILPWSYVSERMVNAINYWISTTRPDGRPSATPVWGVWMDGTLYFDGSPKTRRGRNLAENSAVAVHLEDGTKVVIIEGEAHQIMGPDRELAESLSSAYSEKYETLGYAPAPDTWDSGGLYFVIPKKAFAWTKFPEDTTRWHFVGKDK